MRLFHNAIFYQPSPEEPVCQAMLVDDRKIIEMYPEKPDLSGIETVDLQSAYVYPGFIDTHTHSFEGGLYLLGVDLGKVVDLNDVFQLLAAAKPLSGKIIAFNFDENRIAEKRFPTAAELDRIYPDIPVLLRRIDGHSCVINSCAALKINWEKSLPVGFSGLLRGSWNSQASHWFHLDLDDETILLAYSKAAELGASNGYTTIHTMVGDIRSSQSHYPLIQDNSSRFPLEYILYPQNFNLEQALEFGSSRIGGCLLADGSFGSHTAALHLPFSDQPDHKGSLYHSDEFWLKFIRSAHIAGLQVAVHCIGDRAIDQILKCYETVQLENPKDLRHEIIHNELTSDPMLDREKRAGVSAVMQPRFDSLWAGPGGLYEKVLGKERTLSTNRLQSIYQRKILLTGGSDWYITELDPLLGIHSAVNLHNPAERLNPRQAIEIYTTNAARLSFDENRLGRLAKDYQADFVCLEKDILTTENIADIPVKSVFKAGKCIYDRS